MEFGVSLGLMSAAEATRDATPFNWDQVPVPEGVSPAVWAAHISERRQRYGETFGEFYGVLHQELERLAAANLWVEWVANANGEWILGPPRPDYITPYPDPPDEGTDLFCFGAKLSGAGSTPPVTGDGVTRTYFVVITDADYRERASTELKDIPAADADYEAAREYIFNYLRVPEDQTVFVRDSLKYDKDTLTTDGFLDALASLESKVDSDDVVVLLYSGHAVREAGEHQLPALRLNKGDVTLTQLENQILELKPARFYFINDSCYAEAYNDLLNPEGVEYIGLAAAESDQKASGGAKSGGRLLSPLLRYLSEGRTLQNAYDCAEIDMKWKNEKETDPKKHQNPTLQNPGQIDLKFVPWRDASGAEQLKKIMADPQAKQLYLARVRQMASRDPNDKIGPAGAGPGADIPAGATLTYEIHFENEASADVPAQEVRVTDFLSDSLDWASLQFDAIQFNDVLLRIPPGHQHFAATHYVGSDPYPVAVQADLDLVSGQLTWFLRSFDPATGLLPDDPFAGFLPPNDATGRGEGTLRFNIRVLPDLEHGTLIENEADILFDETYGMNPPIPTPVAENRIDTAPPQSRVASPQGNVLSSFKVAWEGDEPDGGSGVATYDIYVARNGGNYAVWLEGTPLTEAWFTGELGADYAFYSVARDHVGNREFPPATADTAVRVTMLIPKILSVTRLPEGLELGCANLTPGITYVLEQTPSLAGGEWQEAGNFVAVGPTYALRVTWEATASSKFFRLKAPSP